MGNTVLSLRISNSPGSEEKNKVKPCQHSIYNFFSNSIKTFLLKKKSRFHCWKTTYSILYVKQEIMMVKLSFFVTSCHSAF